MEAAQYPLTKEVMDDDVEYLVGDIDSLLAGYGSGSS